MYTDLFQQHGSPSDHAQIWFNSYLRAPEVLTTFESVAHYDGQAAQLIARCKKLMDDMIEYRQALAARYNALATMPSTPRIRLERYVKYDGHKLYYLRHFRDYSDGTSVETQTETFTGQERRAALARFNALKKEFPGIAAEMDIEKKSWEK